MVRRAAALAFSGLLLVAVASPLVRDPGDDSYPLSTYPMFARTRPRIARFATAEGIGADGTASRLTTNVIGGTAEPVHAAVTVQAAIDAGRAPQLCEEVAQRAAARAEHDAMRAVEIVQLDIDLLAWFDQAAPLTRTVITRCPVDR